MKMARSLIQKQRRW